MMNFSPVMAGWFLAARLGIAVLAKTVRHFLHETSLRETPEQEPAPRPTAKRKGKRATGILTMLDDDQRDLVSLHDTDGMVRYASDALLELTGYSRQELIGRQGRDLVHDDDLPALLASIHAAHLDGQAAPVLFRLRNRDGGYIWVEAEFRHSVSRSGEPEVLGVARSIASVGDEEAVPDLPIPTAIADVPVPVSTPAPWIVRREPESGPSLQDLCHAFERREFQLHYQPKIDLARNVCTGVEALLRWETPEGRGRTAEVIAAAEASGFIGMLGEWVLRTAAHQSARWRRAGLRYPISVNLSPVQLRDPALVPLLHELVARDPELPAWLELELTERALAIDDEQMSRTVIELVALGFRLHLDDFAPGPSGLIELAHMPVRAVKVDLPIIQALTEDEPAREFMRSLISTSRSLQLKVIAEGVETPRQLELLQASGCDEVQGFLLSRPMPADRALPFPVPACAETHAVGV